jgi:SAM-dependent methyltransferase
MTSNLTEKSNLMERDLASEFAELAPWIFQFRIGDASYGGGVGAESDARIDQFFQFAPEVATILETGSLEGAQTFLLARHPGVRRVLAIEGREANLRKARFVQELLGVKNAEFVQGNLEEVDLSRFGKFDAVFCCGLLYHLPRPWEFLERLPAVAPILYLWTAYCSDKEAVDLPNGLRGKIHGEGGPDEPLSGLSPTAAWLTLDCLLGCLNASGYYQIKVIEDDPNHVNGCMVTIGARLERVPEPVS